MAVLAPPTEEQLKQYAGQLPDFYQRILRAFPECEPDRRQGFALAMETIYDRFPDEAQLFLDDVQEAVDNLEGQGFLTVSEIGAVAPTPLGERLITALTGHVPRPAKVVPDLPAPPWSLPG